MERRKEWRLALLAMEFYIHDFEYMVDVNQLVPRAKFCRVVAFETYLVRSQLPVIVQFPTQVHYSQDLQSLMHEKALVLAKIETRHQWISLSLVLQPW